MQILRIQAHLKHNGHSARSPGRFEVFLQKTLIDHRLFSILAMDRSGGVVHPIVDQGHIDGPAGSSQYHAEESIGDSVYKLLIKNVSKNQPLTAEEAQVVAYLQNI